MTIAEQAIPNDNFEQIQYKISFERLESLGRSAIFLLVARLPDGAPSVNSKPDYSVKPQKLVDEIAKHSKGQQNYIHNDMPLQEMVFRTLLGKRNRPMSLEDIHHELTEKWSTPVRPITISTIGLKRVIDTDTYYGFIEA